jgi:hypothetical protein
LLFTAGQKSARFASVTARQLKIFGLKFLRTKQTNTLQGNQLKPWISLANPLLIKMQQLIRLDICIFTLAMSIAAGVPFN